MFWHAKTRQFVYSGRIVTSSSDWYELRARGRTSRFVFPVPKGKIVEYLEESYDVNGRRPMYKVNVRLKELI